MPDPVLQCPQCGARIPLTDALARPLEEKLRTRLQREYVEKEKSLKSGLEEGQKKLEAEKAAFKRRKDDLESELEKKVASKLEEYKKKAQEEAKGKSRRQVADLQSELNAERKQREEAEHNEMELRKKAAEADAKMKSFEVEVARKVDEAKEQVEAAVKAKLDANHALEIRDYAEKVSTLRKQIEELNSKSRQGSQQAQGETLELEIEDRLKMAFPEDSIEPVPKGKEGADVVQTVHHSGRECGRIVWEAKRTGKWSSGWIPKLKQDQRSSKSDIAVLVTMAMPSEVQTFGLLSGVIVTGFPYLLPVSAIVRSHIVELAMVSHALSGRNEKKDLLYDYLVGSEFRQDVQAVAESFKGQYDELVDEKAAMLKLWKRRETEIGKGVLNLAEMYGKMQGIAGGTLSDIPALELSAAGRRRALPSDLNGKADGKGAEPASI